MIKKNLVFIITILILFYFFSLRISDIECQISNNNCNPEIYQKLESLKGKSIFFINLEKELNQNEIESEAILLTDYKKVFPGKLVLKFSQEKVLYLFEFDGNSSFISEFGNKLNNDQNINNLPIVNWNAPLDNKIHYKIAMIINNVDSEKFSISKISRENENKTIIEIHNNPKIIIDDNSTTAKLEMIKILLESKEIKEYEQPIKEIDLRFNLPVLRTTQ
ncbi:hypothetical protein KA089_01285 [Candidatus Woesebacteria bacterium]|nr:hypothetical protein [Candidatus Woesebacteria bacterium]